MREKRAHARKLMQEDAFLWDAEGNVRRPVVMLDISRAGVAFTSADLLEDGVLHRLQFCLPGHTERHESMLEVVRSTTTGVPAGYRVGARFVQVAPETIERISGFVGAAAS